MFDRIVTNRLIMKQGGTFYYLLVLVCLDCRLKGHYETS